MYGKTPAAPNEQLNQDIQLLCGEYARYNGFDEELCNKFGVKRGLRNADGTGVVAGITQVCNVHGCCCSASCPPARSSTVFRRSSRTTASCPKTSPRT